VLWSAKQHQGYLHPTAISWGLDNGITAEFDLLGTRDPSAALTAPFSLELLDEFGGHNGVDAIYRYNHELAWWAGQYLADNWGTRFATPEAMIGSMVNVPLPARLGTTDDDADRLRAQLDDAGIEVPVFAGTDQLTLRVCAQIYCDRADIEHLGDVVAKLAAN
jgi:isopenicillin-N epimerase